MSIIRKTPLILASVSLGLIAACTSPAHLNENDPNKNAKSGALLGGILGAGVGALVSDDKGKGAVIGGVVGAAGGVVAGSLLDEQESKLRQSLGNDDVTITNTGDRLIVSLPQDILLAQFANCMHEAPIAVARQDLADDFSSSHRSNHRR